MNATTPAADILTGLASLAAADDLSVGKDGFNKHFGYGYMTEAALFTAARAALAEAGMSATLSFENGHHEIIPTFDKDGGRERPGILATITARLTIRDQTGNSVECTAYGQGLDTADKAYYKAMTGAAKYAVQKGLMIAVESEDTDAGNSGAVAGRSSQSSGGGSGVASEKQLGFLASLVKKAHLIESTNQQDVEGMALRLARMQGDTADAFPGMSKAAASALIEKLQVIPPHRGQEVVDKLVAWEVENGVAPAAPTADAQPAAAPANDDDIPF